MRGKGQLLISALLLFFLNVVAQNEGAHAKGSSNSDDGKVRVTSSTLTSPSEGKSSSSSSSSSAAFSVQTAMNEGVDTPQTKLSPSFATAGVDSPLLFTNHAHKLPFMAVYSLSPSPSSLPSNPEQAEIGNVDPEEREQSNHRHYHRHYRRARREAYTVPYFVGKRVLGDRTDLDLKEFQKRNVAEGSLVNNVANQDESLDLNAEDPVTLTDKRYAPMFVGKREARHNLPAYSAPYFVGKRALEESEDSEQEELQKRNIPSSDTLENDHPDEQFQSETLDLPKEDADVLAEKRHAPLFIGKRGAPYFVGKRRAVPYFVGKRGAPHFVGKRGWAPYFVGKRGAPYFVGKRGWAPYFVGKRQAPYFVGRRSSPTVSTRGSPLFVGRRGYAPLFVGKKHAPMFVGKRAPEPLFVGKRAAPMFVGKRPSKDWSDLLSALHTLQAARHYRRMIQADKRHHAPFFVGRRSSPQTDEDRDTNTSPEANKGDYFR
ncbi:uncharacterized protein LOC143284500 isoform X2 [Babylonia areolata]|uniref:uncharacterized protein LOC143284500 isoform X2 n=1 Tax=Babylonia areolata TaxID=304850 RepID=UPI003FCFF40D